MISSADIMFLLSTEQFYFVFIILIDDFSLNLVYLLRVLQTICDQFLNFSSCI